PGRSPPIRTSSCGERAWPPCSPRSPRSWASHRSSSRWRSSGSGGISPGIVLDASGRAALQPLPPSSGCSSAVERQLPKLDVVGSSPITRSMSKQFKTNELSVSESRFAADIFARVSTEVSTSIRVERHSDSRERALVGPGVPLRHPRARVPESLRDDLKRDAAGGQARGHRVSKVVEAKPPRDPGETFRRREIANDARHGERLALARHEYVRVTDDSAGLALHERCPARFRNRDDCLCLRLRHRHSDPPVLEVDRRPTEREKVTTT